MLGNNNSPNVGAGSVSGAKVPPLIREFVQSLDDKEWQSALFGLLQNQVSLINLFIILWVRGNSF